MKTTDYCHSIAAPFDIVLVIRVRWEYGNGDSGSGFSLVTSNFKALANATASQNGLNEFLIASSTGNSPQWSTADCGSYGFAVLSSNNNLVHRKHGLW